MAEIEITLPTVQYGNVKVRATPEEFGMRSLADAYELGVALAVYQTSFTLGWREGAQMDVSAPEKPSQMASEEQARRLLGEGLGGVTELSEYNNDGPRDVDLAALDAAEDARTGDEYTRAPGPEGDALFQEAAKAPGPLNQHPSDGPEESDDAPWNKKPTPVKKPWEQGNEPAKPSVTLDAGW